MFSTMEKGKSLWIFGYGSLVWKPQFQYVSKTLLTASCFRRHGFIKGWKRRFWQGSTDHRGVPEKPGRVVTLLPSPEDWVWGMCYEIHEDMIDATLSYLDVREKGGYIRDFVSFYECCEDCQPILERVLVYTATETNPEFLGEVEEKEIARTLLESVGPSGPNIEYFERLFCVLNEHNIVDDHILEIDRHLKEVRNAIQSSVEAKHMEESLKI